MMSRRQERLNSLLREVISEVLLKDVDNPDICSLTSITKVEITKDLFQAKVYVSVIADKKAQEKTMKALESAAGFIGIHAAKKVVLKYFPTLTFILDKSVEKQLKIEEILKGIESERNSREENS